MVTLGWEECEGVAGNSHPASYLIQCSSVQMAKEANQAMETKLEDESRKFEEIREYISREEYPDGSSKSDKLVIRRRAKDYQIIDGLLHYVGHLKKCGLEGDPTKRVSGLATQ